MREQIRVFRFDAGSDAMSFRIIRGDVSERNLLAGVHGLRESARIGHVLVNVYGLTGVVSVIQIRHIFKPDISLSSYTITLKPLLFTEHYFSNLPSISAVAWSNVGGAELVSLSSFNCYQLGDLSRRVEGARTIYSVRRFSRQQTREFFSSSELLGKGKLEEVARPNPVEEHCQIVRHSAWDDVCARMDTFDEWMHFRKELYELEVQKSVAEHVANIKTTEPSVNHEYMCIRFLSKDLREIAGLHRAQRILAGLPIEAPEASIVGDDHLDQGHDHQDEAPIPQQELQAQEKHQPATEDTQWTLERQAPADNDESQTHSSFGSFGRCSTHNEDSVYSLGPYDDPNLSESPTFSGNFPAYNDATVYSLGPNPFSEANKSTDHQGPYSSELQLVVHTEKHNNFGSGVQAKPASSAAPEPLDPPTLKCMDATSQALTTLADRVYSLDVMYARMREDTNLTRHHTTQLRNQVTSAVDGLEIKIDVLQATLYRKMADSQQNFAVLEATMVRNYADSQQQLMDEHALVNS
ncbi:hypothetical protein F511_14903 [Dorcoceras hygrometricum]|uniref:Uncharacterized protein n=1 Tax=Dorcoceras hygrometricum TaxID=472368 RepID=A0A2Z7BGE2_9LAMI|nr:hypothetical protein F511_14903 [Dorcoceras hygrometricum]